MAGAALGAVVMSYYVGILLRSQRFVGGVGQACDSYSTVAFVANVEADQQRGDLFDDARVLKFAAVDGAYARNLHGEFYRNLRGIRIIAAHDHVAVDIVGEVAVEHICRDVLKCCHYGNALWNQLRRLLRRGALPHAEGAAGASADACSEWNRSIDQNAPRADRRLQLFEQCGLAFERNGEHKEIAGGAGRRIFHPGNLSMGTDAFADRLRCLLGADRIARTDDHGFSRACPAQRKACAGGASASDHGDRAAHANSGAKHWEETSGAASQQTGATGSLIFMCEYFVLRSAGMRPISRIND